MKKSIATTLNSFVHDNKEFIMENGGNVAEYIIGDADARDQGWLWFLSDNEIEEFENNREKRAVHIQEIKDFVNANYNYYISDKYD